MSSARALALILLIAAWDLHADAIDQALVNPARPQADLDRDARKIGRAHV